MKKKIFILLSVLYLFNVNYSYALELEYTDVPNNDSNYELINTEKRYMWYSENLVSKGYSDNLNIDLENTYIDENDYQLEYSEWREYNNETNLNLEFRKRYDYQKIMPLRYIQISSKDTVNISELEIYVNNEIVEYNVGCMQCDIKERYNLYDQIIDKDNYYELSYRGVMLVELKQYYPLEQIQLKIYSINNSKNNDYKIYFTENPYQYDVGIYKDNLKIENQYSEDISYNTFNIDDSWLFNTKYEEVKTTYEYVKDSWHTKVNIVDECRDVYKKYHYYEIEKNYIDGYYKENPMPSLNLIKDENSYKLFYKYRLIANDYETNNSYNNNYNLNDIFKNYYSNAEESIEIPNTSFDVDELIKLQQSNMPLNADVYEIEDYNTLLSKTNEEEIIEKTDTSNFETKKIKDNNISKLFNFKNLKIAGLTLTGIILIIIYINSRYRKS